MADAWVQARAPVGETVVVAALYHFARLDDHADLQAPLKALCEARGIRGTLLLAREGVNGTISGTRAGIDAVLAWLRADARLAGLEHKESFSDRHPFLRLKIKLKQEIVTLGVPFVDPNEVVGTYVAPQDWNALISDPEVVVIDTRNDYEVAIGSFQGAIDPRTRSFREFPRYVAEHLDPAKHRKVAMFCTGGIRCEKSTAFLKAEGIEDVYHLQGGILKYLETVPAEESLWEGECFVFDQRVTVRHGLELGSLELCHACRRPINADDRASLLYEVGVSCPACYEERSDEQRARYRERQHQVALADAQGKPHIGAVMAPRDDGA